MRVARRGLEVPGVREREDGAVSATLHAWLPCAAAAVPGGYLHTLVAVLSLIEFAHIAWSGEEHAIDARALLAITHLQHTPHTQSGQSGMLLRCADE